MRRLHLAVGFVGVVAFLMTGQYMDRWLGHLAGMADLPRMLHRSAHIYLLFAALLNVLLGLYAEDPHGWRRGVARLGSVLILVAPVMILIGFSRESTRTDFERPFVGFAIYGCFAGVLLHAIARGSPSRAGGRDSFSPVKKRVRIGSIPHAHARMVGILLLLTAGVASAVAPARFVRFSEARPILNELAGKLPPELNTLTPAQMETAWPAWIERHDREIRARLEQGDEDTLVNWMLFGTSFTSRPRAVLGAVESGTAADRELVLRRTIELISARLDDLLTALAAPGSDERRLFARALLQRRGLRVATAADRDAAAKYLLAAVIRVAGEQDQIDQELGATSGGDPLAEFVQRSRLFRTRGLSLDTSLMANYSVEQALAAMKARGLLEPGSVKRVAIVGPGLDFADKDVGFDIYPQQTLQPFAVLDSLKRLGLAPSPADPEIVLLDISPRIIDHLTQARARAAKNTGYTLNLPLPKSTAWLPDVRRYWQTFGDQIGAPAQAPTSKALAELAELRAVRARPSAVQRMSVLDVNIVTERLDGEAFDLVIATNVFIYYDVLEQALAMANVEAMLKPGAFLLANFSAPRLTSITMRSLETTRTLYARAGGGNEDILDFIVWYRRSP